MMQLRIVSPEKVVYDGEVQQVIVKKNNVSLCVEV